MKSLFLPVRCVVPFAFGLALTIALPSAASAADPVAAPDSAARKQKIEALEKQITTARAEEAAARKAKDEKKAQAALARRRPLEAEQVPLVYAEFREYHAGMLKESGEEYPHWPETNALIRLEAQAQALQQKLAAIKKGDPATAAQAKQGKEELAKVQADLKRQEPKAIFEAVWATSLVAVFDRPEVKERKEEFQRRYAQREAAMRQAKDNLLENPRYPLDIADRVITEMPPAPPKRVDKEKEREERLYRIAKLEQHLERVQTELEACKAEKRTDLITGLEEELKHTQQRIEEAKKSAPAR